MLAIIHCQHRQFVIEKFFAERENTFIRRIFGRVF